MTRISHAALWVRDLEREKDFYVRFFGASANEKYVNAIKGFESYFLSFEGGARLELMRKEGVDDTGFVSADPNRLVMPERLGFAHLAFSVGSEERVDGLTAELERAGFPLVSPPRRTGDGYYESAVADPEGNVLEITV